MSAEVLGLPCSPSSTRARGHQLLTPAPLTVESVMNTLVLPQCSGAGSAWRMSWRRPCSMAGSAHGGHSEMETGPVSASPSPQCPRRATGFLPAAQVSQHPFLPFGEEAGVGLFSSSPRLSRGISGSPWRLCPALAGSPHPGGPLGQGALGT